MVRQQAASVLGQDDTATLHPTNHQAKPPQIYRATTTEGRRAGTSSSQSDQTLGTPAPHYGIQERVHRWAGDSKGPTAGVMEQSMLQRHMH
jgi:hypothetical protein